jgi:hypothetical protein
MDHLTTAPVEFKSLAICGIEGVNVPIIESTHTLEMERQANSEWINIQCITMHPDTIASMIFFLVDENRR